MHGVVYKSVSLCGWRNVWDYADIDKPHRDTHTHKVMCASICVRLKSTALSGTLRASCWDVCVCVCTRFWQKSRLFSVFLGRKRQQSKSQQSTCWFMQLLVPSITPTTTTEAEFVLHYFWCMRVLAVQSKVRINSQQMIYAAPAFLLLSYIRAGY